MNVKPSVIVGVGVLTLSAALAGQSADLTEWRGQGRDGVVAFTEPRVWPEQLVRRWKVEVGTGYATPLLVGNRVYVFARLGENETMQALDAETGKTLWRAGYPAAFTMQSAAARHGTGPKSTPVFSGGRLYSIGMTGVVTAFDAGSGKQLWQRPGSDLVPMYTTHSFSPIVDRGLVIFHVGGHMKGALTAFDVNTGAVRWSWDGDGPGYGSPIVAELGGTRQLVTITQGKIVGVNVATGALLWERPYVSPNFVNSMTPFVVGQSIIVSGPGPTLAFAVVQRDNQWTTENLWENADLPMRMSNPVVVGDVLFGLANRNMGQYFALDVTTGKTLWTTEGRQAGNAAILRTGNTLFSLEDDGELVVVRGSATAFEPLKRYKVADSDTWTQPLISGNRIYVKDVSSLTLWTVN